MSRSRETIPAIAQTVTDAQIAAAMDRAAALKRRTTLHPEWLCVQPMRAGDALDATARYRYHRYGPPWLHQGADDRWIWIGWIAIEEPWPSDRPARPCYDATWEVWLHADDGRVWLRLERQIRDADDPFP